MQLPSRSKNATQHNENIYNPNPHLHCHLDKVSKGNNVPVNATLDHNYFISFLLWAPENLDMVSIRTTHTNTKIKSINED